jgi:hypothetical protein
LVIINEFGRDGITPIVDLTGNVTLYPQEKYYWCGAACAQMIMNGYPDAAYKKLILQGPPDPLPSPVPTNCYTEAHNNNSDDPTDQDQEWYVDPIGLRECLRNLNPPPGGDWGIFSKLLAQEVMFDILYWMNKNHYPVTTLIDSGDHWVVIVGFETDVEPIAGSNPDLKELTIYDPEPVNVGSIHTDTWNGWIGEYGAWETPVDYAGTWKDTYVAVIEPPVANGVVKTKKVMRIGRKLIEPEEAMALARKYIDELRFFKRPEYAILRQPNVRPLEPIIVQEETISKKIGERKPPQYYIVPFNLKSERGRGDVPLVRLSMVVNAFTGNFEGVTAFGKPIRYIPVNEAISLALKSLKLRIPKRDVHATMIFAPSEITHVRAYPFWKIEVKDKIVYVDQLGKIYEAIKRGRPGR